MAILNVHNSERLMKEFQKKKNGNNISDDELIAISKIVSARTVKRFRTRRLPIVDLIFDEMIRIVRGVKLNFDEQFVKTCFKYGIYEKKTYNNPQFFKENKNSIVYICDDSKKGD